MPWTQTNFLSYQGARDTAQLTRRQVQRSAENALEDFVHISVATLEKQKGVSTCDYISSNNSGRRKLLFMCCLKYL